MTYTKEQVELFNRMFTIIVEKTCYQKQVLTEEGFMEEAPDDFIYNTACARITLSNGNEYIIESGVSDHAEELAEEAFQKFIELNYDEKAFEKYLQDESDFSAVE